MIYKDIHLKIIKSVMKYEGVNYWNNPEHLLAPSKETLPSMFEGDYSELTISEAIDELISNNVLEFYSMHYYLRIHQCFYDSEIYEEIKELLNKK